MKKLYLLATLLCVAFSGNVATAGGLKKTLPVTNQIHQGLRGLERPAAPVEKEKKSETLLTDQGTLSPRHKLTVVANPIPQNLLQSRGEVQLYAAPRESAPRYGLTVDDHDVITAPAEGVYKIYQRSGGNYYLGQNQKQVYSSDQSQCPYLETVETPDGTVYIKDILSTVTIGTWVKGTKTDGKIIVPAGQPLYYSADRGAHLRVQWGQVVEPYFTYMEEHPADFTFDIIGDSVALQGTSKGGAFIGAFWDNDMSFLGYGDYETGWKYLDVQKKSHELVQLPEGIEVEPWILTTASLSSTKDLVYDERRIRVAINGLDFYVQGLFRNYPNAWIHGDLVGKNVYFDTDQYLGLKDGTEGWACGLTAEGEDILSTDFAFQYDAEKNTLYCTTPIASNQHEFKWALKDIYYAAYIEKWTPVEFNVPFVDSLTHSENFLNYELVDANQDGYTWNFDSNNNLAVCFFSMDLIASDDWMISPAVNLTADQLYNFRLDAAARDAKYTEKFLVKIGKAPSPEAMTQTLIDTLAINNEAFDTFSSEDFKVAESGKYYIGIQCVSDPNMWRLALRSIGMSIPKPGVIPAAVSEAEVRPDAEGALQAEVVFTAPDKDNKGQALEGDVQVIVQVDEVTVDTITVAAGAQGSYLLKVNANQVYNVSLIPFVVEGKDGQKTRVSAWIGEDVPTIAKISGRNIGSKVFLSWAVADSGVHGAVVIPEKVTYKVYSTLIYEASDGLVFVNDQLLTPEPISATEFVIENEEFAECKQGSVGYNVVAENVAGQSEETTGLALVGKPYSLPFLEDFDGATLKYYWSGYGKIEFEDNDEGDNSYATIYGEEGKVAYLSTGKISLKGEEDPSLSLDVASYYGTPVKVYVDAASGTLEQIASFETTEEFVKQKVSLKDYVNEEWVVIILAGLFEQDDFLVLDNVAISDLPDNDLTVSLSAPASVLKGKTAQLEVTVENLGEVPASNYAVRVYADDNLVAEVDPKDIKELAFGREATYEVDYAVSLFTTVPEATLRAEVTFSADEDTNNNIDEVEISFRTPEEETVMSVAAATTAQGLSISWQPQEIKETECLEDFESYDDQCVEDGQYLGRWMGYDGDKLSSYTIDYEDMEIDWAFDDLLYAFCVWTPSLYTSIPENLAFSARGEKSLLFMGGMSVEDVESSDDWLVSPELTGKAQTISFWASEVTDEYGEEIYEVYYSTTDRDRSSFQLLTTDQVDTTEFTQRHYDLPEGAKYFAIRYVSEDVYTLIIDDIRYQGYNVERPAGYHLFVDEELVATLDADVTSYDYVSDLADGTHKVSVSVFYPGDRESLPVSTRVAVSAIETLSAEPVIPEVYTLSGLRLRTDKPRQSGLYIINGRKTAL